MIAAPATKSNCIAMTLAAGLLVLGVSSSTAASYHQGQGVNVSGPVQTKKPAGTLPRTAHGRHYTPPRTVRNHPTSPIILPRVQLIGLPICF